MVVCLPHAPLIPTAVLCHDNVREHAAAGAVFVLSTAENFPDIMLPAYHCNRAYAWVFILFFVIGVYFILNLVLAVAFSEFMEITKEKVCPASIAAAAATTTLHVACLSYLPLLCIEQSVAATCVHVRR